MNDYKTYSIALNKCVFDTIKMREDFSDEHKEVLDKSLINRMYYALYNRLVTELEEVQNTTANKHKQIYDILTKQSSNREIERVKDVFEDMKRLREWADYKPYYPTPPYNLNTLQEKVYKIISREKIFN